MIFKVINRLKSKIKVDKHFSELLRGSLSSFALKILGMLFSYASVLYITNYFGASEFGQYTLGMTILSIVILIPKFGMDQSLVRIVGELFSKNDINGLYLVVKKSIFIMILLSILSSVILYLNTENIASLINKPELKQTFQIISYAILPMAWLGIISAVIQGMRKTIVYTVTSSVLIPGLFLMAVIFSTLNNIELTPIDLYVATIFIVGILSLLIFMKVRPINPKAKELKTYPLIKIVQISFPMLLASSFVLIMTWTDILMLSYYVTEVDIGVYSAAQRVAGIASISLVAINAIAAPKFVQFYTNNDMAGLAKIAQQSTKLMFFTSLPVLMLIFIMPETIMCLFGDEFIAGVAVLLFLSFAQFVNAFSGSVGYIMQMTDNQKTFQNIILLAAVLNIVLNYFLIPKYGVNGAAFASMVSMIFWNITLVFIIKIRMGFYTIYIPYKEL